VAEEPKPRSDADAAPAEKLPEPANSVKPPAALLGSSRNSWVTVVWPERRISSAVIICIGDAVSASTRLMLEPVTSIFSIFCGGDTAVVVCASAWPASNVAAAAMLVALMVAA